VGVDFFPCDKCGETICDAGPWWECEECGHVLCSTCEGELDADPDDEDEALCPYCAGEVATDSDLLEFALEKLGLTRKELLDQYAETCLKDDEEKGEQ
jgi:hypothetical protein